MKKENQKIKQNLIEMLNEMSMSEIEISLCSSLRETLNFLGDNPEESFRVDQATIENENGGKYLITVTVQKIDEEYD